ncbi:O-methyltransferase-domain-containing protein [Bisporella sp. PMI_857]|nr:O-methyltransferase-domain-containing protein [Bisporella sp. PMI_857]
MTSLPELVSGISSKTDHLVSLLKSSGIDLPSWDENAPAEFAESGPHAGEIQRTRYALIDQLTKALQLAMGPTEYVKSLISNAPLDIGSMRAIIKFDIPACVPLGSDIAITKLATKSEVDPEALRRILSYCKTNGVFRETRPGYIAHTAASAALAVGDLGSAMRWSVDIPALSGLRIFDALKLFGPSDSPRECAFNIAYMTEETMFEYQERNPQIAALFSDNMKTESGATRLSPKHAAVGFDWSQIGSGTVVDMGGSNGHVSCAISEAYPLLKFIVQDCTAEISLWQKQLPEKFADKVTYQYHDFFTPQKTKGDVYFFRYIIHNWADIDAVRIIKSLAPVLKSKKRLVIMEYLGPQGSEMGEFEERTYRLRDLQMLSFLGSRERTLEMYKALVSKAIPRLSFVGFQTPVGSSMSMMEWIYI